MSKIKKTLALLTIVIAATAKLYATDLIVEEFGVSPTYPSITSAVAAAVDGDRIIVKNRAGNIPWIENISVAKSLQFLSFDNDTFFVVQGNYTVTGATGRTVSFIGMRNLSGSIGYSSGSTIKSTTVNIMNSKLENGSVTFNSPNYLVNLISSQIDNGYVYLQFGSVIGNSITTPNGLGTNSVTVSSNSAYQSDTVMIAGNKITDGYTSGMGIYWNSPASIAHIRNNFVIHSSVGIQISITASSAYYNLVYGNTILAVNTTYSVFGIYITGVPSGSILEVMNNVVDATSSGGKYGIYNGGSNNGQTNLYYNHVDPFNTSTTISTGFTFSGNNTVSTGFSLASDGRLVSGVPAIDGGNPAKPYSDLDLSVGDAGAYGGSYTIDNFFPLFNGSARVYMVHYPFNVRQGNTLNVKANAFDR